VHAIRAAQICNKRTIALQEQQAQARAAAEAAAAQREAERAAAFRRFNAQGNYHASNHLHQFLQHAGPSMGGAYPGGHQNLLSQLTQLMGGGLAESEDDDDDDDEGDVDLDSVSQEDDELLAETSEEDEDEEEEEEGEAAVPLLGGAVGDLE